MLLEPEALIPLDVEIGKKKARNSLLIMVMGIYMCVRVGFISLGGRRFIVSAHVTTAFTPGLLT